MNVCVINMFTRKGQNKSLQNPNAETIKKDKLTKAKTGEKAIKIQKLEN